MTVPTLCTALHQHGHYPFTAVKPGGLVGGHFFMLSRMLWAKHKRMGTEWDTCVALLCTMSPKTFLWYQHCMSLSTVFYSVQMKELCERRRQQNWFSWYLCWTAPCHSWLVSAFTWFQAYKSTRRCLKPHRQHFSYLFTVSAGSLYLLYNYLLFQDLIYSTNNKDCVASISSSSISIRENKLPWTQN